MIIAGQLLTKVGGPIQWATITFDPSIGDSISFGTDFEGKYSCNVPVGNYRVYKKEKHGIDIELLGENVAVDATGTLDLESLIDRNTVPAYTAATLPDPATLAPGATVVVGGIPAIKNKSTIKALASFPKKNIIGGYGVFCCYDYAVANASPCVATYEIEIPVNVTHLRFHLINGDTSAAYTVSGARIAYADALGKDGTTLTQKVVSFSDSATPKKLPPCTSTATTTVSVPAADGTAGTGVNVVNNGVWSDWCAADSIARTDDVAGCIVQIRVAIAGGAKIVRDSSAVNMIPFNQYPGNNRKWRGNFTLGDLTSIASITCADNMQWHCIDGIEFVCADKSVKHILEVGDSISRGSGYVSGTVGITGPGWIASQDMPDVTYTSKCVHGRKSAAYVLEGMKALSGGLYDTIIIPCYTRNDGLAVDHKAEWANILTLVNYARYNGVSVILRGATPDVALDATYDVARLYIDVKAKTLAESDPNIFFVDYNSLVTDGANPQRQQAIYSAGSDGIHPNNVAIELCAQLYKDLFAVS